MTSQVSRMLPGLKKAESHADVRILLDRVFCEMFGRGTAGQPERCHDSAVEIWSYWKSFESSEAIPRDRDKAGTSNGISLWIG